MSPAPAAVEVRRPVRSVLLVDDDANVLSAIRRLLRRGRGRMAVTTALGGQEAIDALCAAPYDVLVTDVRMPAVDGRVVLAHARSRRPEMLRVALSGYADPSVVVDTALLAHRFLAKPCDSDRLIATIDAAGRLAARLPDRIRRDLGSIVVLPAAPSVLARAATLLTGDPSAEDLGRAVSGDVALTAGLLHLVGASTGAPMPDGADAAAAIAYLGVPVVRQMIGRFLAAAADGPAADTAEHLLARARAGASDPVGDLGRLALAAGCAITGAERRGAPPDGPDHQELETWPVDPREVGSYLAELWDVALVPPAPDPTARTVAPDPVGNRVVDLGTGPPIDGVGRPADARAPVGVAVTRSGPSRAEIDVRREGI